MRCDCCNRKLNDFESTLRDTRGEFLNTCRKCLKGLGIPAIGRADLDPTEQVSDEIAEEEEFDLSWLDEDGEEDGLASGLAAGRFEELE
jgi:hypothetical protein